MTPSGGQVSGDATIDFHSGAVTGWARACAGTADGQCASMTSRTDGWDGWISLSGSNYASPDATGNGGVTLSTTTGAISGFAWGSDVVGWITFKANAQLGGGVTVSTGPTNPSNGAPTCSLTTTTTPSPLTSSGGNVTIKWTSTNATACQGENFSTGGATSNNTGVNTTVSNTTNYLLSCSNATYTTPLVCSNTTVTVPLPTTNQVNNQLNLFIGSTPSSLSTVTQSSSGHKTLSIAKGSVFALKWINTLPASYSQAIVIATAPDGSDAGSTIGANFTFGNNSESNIPTANLQTGTYSIQILATDPLTFNTHSSDTVQLKVSKSTATEF